MFAQIVSEDNFYLAFCKTQKGKVKTHHSATRFYLEEGFGLQQLRLEVMTGNYLPNPYSAFRVYEPKERLIYAPHYRDKIVQHAINNTLAPYFKLRFIQHTYACIEGRGNQRAVLQLNRQFYNAKQRFGDQAYILSIDIEKFFYRIDREVLKAILARYIDCPLTLQLLYLIIDHSPGDLGLPLGNLTSQLFANIYLNELDQYCKRVLRLPYYLRYADDIYLVVSSKAEARDLKNELSKFIQETLNITAHPRKTRYGPLDLGVSALGFIVTPKGILLTSKQKRTLRNVLNGDLGEQELNQRIVSWMNHSQIANRHTFISLLGIGLIGES